MIFAKIALKVSTGIQSILLNIFDCPKTIESISMKSWTVTSIFWFYPVFRILLNCLRLEKCENRSYPTVKHCFYSLSPNYTGSEESEDVEMMSEGSWRKNRPKFGKLLLSSFSTVWFVKGRPKLNAWWIMGKVEARISANPSSIPNQLVFLPILPLTGQRLRRGPFLPSAHH